MQTSAYNFKHAILIGFFLVLAVFVAYAPTFQFGLVNYDDVKYVSTCEEIKAGLSIDGIRWSFTNLRVGNWQPLTLMSYQLDATLFGENYGWFHAVNVLLHAMVVVLTFVLLLRTTGALWKSAIVAAFFALHPSHVESVAWVSERKDVLSAMLGMVTLIVYVEYARKPSVLRMFWVGFWLSMGLLAKPMLVTWPAVMLLLDVWPLRRLSRDTAGEPPVFARATPLRLAAEKLPLVLIVIAFSIATVIAQRTTGATVDLSRIPLIDRIATAVVGYVRYLGLTFWPVDLAVFYPWRRWMGWHVAGAITILILITGLVVRFRRELPMVLIGWLWFLGTLVPVIGLVQVGGQSLADRYTYIPHIGLFIAIVWGVAAILEKAGREQFQQAARALTLVLLLGAAIATRRQVMHWENSVTLWTHALSVTTDNFPALRNLAMEYIRLNQREKAIPLFKETARIAPHLADVQSESGMFLFSMGQPVEAIKYLARASILKPEDKELRKNLAAAYTQAGWVLGGRKDIAGAAKYFEAALKFDPELKAAQDNLARARMMLGTAQTQPQ